SSSRVLRCSPSPHSLAFQVFITPDDKTRPLTAARIRHDLPTMAMDEVVGSCIQPLRIIHSTPKPATMSSLHHHPRGHCHGTNPLFLRTRSRGAGVRLPAALRALAQRRRFPSAANRANHTIPTQTLHGAQTVCWPDPATVVRPV